MIFGKLFMVSTRPIAESSELVMTPLAFDVTVATAPPMAPASALPILVPDAFMRGSAAPRVLEICPRMPGALTVRAT